MDTIPTPIKRGPGVPLDSATNPMAVSKARYQLMGLFEGSCCRSSSPIISELADFTPFHDEIRRVFERCVDREVCDRAAAGASSMLGNQSFGLFHAEAGDSAAAEKFGFYYVLTRAATNEFPTNTVLSRFSTCNYGRRRYDLRRGGWWARLIREPVEPVSEVACKFDGRM